MAERATERTGSDGIIRRKRSDGTTGFRWTWREGGGRDGARRSFTRDKLGDAKALRAAIIANGYRMPEDLGEALPVGEPAARRRADAGPTFADYGREHIKLRTGIGARQRNDLQRDLKRHMEPYFDALAVDEKTAIAWLRGLEDGTHPWLLRELEDGVTIPAPLAPRTRERLVTQAGAILNAAKREGLVDSNPFQGLRVGRVDHDREEEQVILTHDEWRLLRKHLPDGVGRALPDLLIGTGARWGEGTALAVRHVDAGKQSVRIRRSWQDDGRGNAKLGPTKSRKSRRAVKIDAKTLARIEPFVRGRHGDELLFRASNGERLRPSNFWRGVWRPAVEKAQADGLTKSPRIHDLRHTHVAWLIDRNVSMAVIQRRLGHDSITTTIDTYGHMLPTAEDAAVDAIDDALGDGD